MRALRADGRGGGARSCARLARRASTYSPLPPRRGRTGSLMPAVRDHHARPRCVCARARLRRPRQTSAAFLPTWCGHGVPHTQACGSFVHRLRADVHYGPCGRRAVSTRRSARAASACCPPHRTVRRCVARLRHNGNVTERPGRAGGRFRKASGRLARGRADVSHFLRAAPSFSPPLSGGRRRGCIARAARPQICLRGCMATGSDDIRQYLACRLLHRFASASRRRPPSLGPHNQLLGCSEPSAPPATCVGDVRLLALRGVSRTGRGPAPRSHFCGPNRHVQTLKAIVRSLSARCLQARAAMDGHKPGAVGTSRHGLHGRSERGHPSTPCARANSVAMPLAFGVPPRVTAESL